MSLKTKRVIIALLAASFVGSLLFVQWLEVLRRKQEAGLAPAPALVPASSKECVACHSSSSPGIVEHWKGSEHSKKGVGCTDCHQADAGDVDAFQHYGQTIATIVTPRDCGRCHTEVAAEFGRSHHAKAGNILASLDNLLAETVEGAREPFDPHSPTPGRESKAPVNGLASVQSGCRQCHGGKVALKTTDGKLVTVDDLKPGEDGKPTVAAAAALVLRDANGKPQMDPSGWPNTGIGRLNLDGSRGACSACHSRHDFSPRRARQPENCGKCHLGPDHPQKEIYEESKHGVAFRDLREQMKLDGETWILGKDYSQAPTCATCHMSGNSRNGGRVTHDPGERISWTNRPPVSLVMDTDAEHRVVTEKDPEKRRGMIADSWQNKRNRMKEVCSHCHGDAFVNGFYAQYDDLVVLYNEKFAKPGQKIIDALTTEGLLTKKQFDEEIEWTWYYLWHHEGRRARHGASMMAPDYTHWHGMYEVADRFYTKLLPEAHEITRRAAEAGKKEKAGRVEQVIAEILARPEHRWTGPPPASPSDAPPPP
ncbi:MAG: multiheme c-type cytochrome [Polyangiaceae bacterium]